MKIVRILIGLVLCLVMLSWGYLGHQNINYKAPVCLPTAMTGFGVWTDSLSIHGSDADNRKSSDSNEGPRHYIDIDNYSEFIAKKRIASTYDSIVKIHGVNFVISNGTLPWATRVAYDSLKNAFKKHQWHNAMLYASDLGHYVADGHMPLHITSNYDGAQTGQNGIHSRYESTMVANYISLLTNYSATSAQTVPNVNLYIMNYIYKNQLYVDSVLKADTYATTSAGNSTSTQYYTALWTKTRFTTTLFKNASRALADLIYSAWVEVGSPVYGSKLLNGVNPAVDNNLSVYPNPSSGKVWINSTNILRIETFSCNGSRVSIDNSNVLDFSTLSNGIYVLKIYENNGTVHHNNVMLQH